MPESFDWLKNYPPEVAPTISSSEDLSIAQLLQKTCQVMRDKPAMSCMGATISFHQFEVLATKFAAFLKDHLGLKPGERFAVMLPNIMQFPIGFYAAQKAGLVCVNTNPSYTPTEMSHQFADSGAKAVLLLDTHLEKLSEIIDQTEIKHVITTSVFDQLPRLGHFIYRFTSRIRRSKKSKLHPISFQRALTVRHWQDFTPHLTSPGDVAVLQYTGGTTGPSKGAMLTQANITANIKQINQWGQTHMTPGEEVILTALPLFHVFALTVNFLCYMSMGGHMILVTQPTPIKNTVKMFKRYRITVFTAVNTLFNALNNDPGFQKLAPKTIKLAMAGGMALQESVAVAWKSITKTGITLGYGLSETSPVTHCSPYDGSAPVGSIGFPLPSTNAKIVDQTGEEVPIGEDGELLIKGPQVMLGYWKNPEATVAALKDGWLRTGDIARRDRQGYFYIVDRKKDMIIVSGFKVYPNEVEGVLVKHPKILEAAVIGVPDDQSGEAVKAYIVRKDPTLSRTDTEKFAAQFLTSYKRPKIYEFIAELPKSNVGKILRKNLRN